MFIISKFRGRLFPILNCSRNILQAHVDSSGVSNFNAREKILQLALGNESTSNNPDIDVMLVGAEVMYFSRVLRTEKAIIVPKEWCSNLGAKQTFNSSPVAQKLMECYKPNIHLENETESIAKSLRLLRDSFQRENIPLVMTYGSLIESLRYHRRSPFDSDYDMSVRQDDWPRIEKILTKHAFNTSNRMRIFDLRPAAANLKLALACAINDSWRDPTLWTSFGNKLKFSNGYPVALNWAPYKAFMSDCGVYIDFYINGSDNEQFKAYPDGTVLYRPIEGILLQTVINCLPFLESVYHSSIELCMSKTDYYWKGELTSFPEYCTNMSVPCAWLDTIYPRVYKFDVPEKGLKMEVGLVNTLDGECLVRSIFYTQNIGFR
ncbi:unnamed protein product [Rodentolepis nana]|uniref:Fukutin-related protein n=1 Tax=Rodentolepis nana TaxID=102285 RepID=A0A0R3T6S0_RODNA|nr:unnamed protein product [Rodentolepis nana]